MTLLEHLDFSSSPLMVSYASMLLLGYILGSVPFGLLIGWAFGRVDVREYGSGKIGSTNALRTIGVKAAVLSLVLDMGKSVLTVIISRILFDSYGADAIGAFACLIGHNWPVFVRFRGGRGVASGWGGAFILFPLSGVMAGLLGLPIIALTKYVSLGSLIGSSAGAATIVWLSVTDGLPDEYVGYAICGLGLIIFRHRDNIYRLLKGSERKLGQSVDLDNS